MYFFMILAILCCASGVVCDYMPGLWVGAVLALFSIAEAIKEGR